MLAVDVVSPAESPAAFLLADLTDFGQTVECLAGDTLHSIQKARRLLGYEPRWSWRDHVSER